MEAPTLQFRLLQCLGAVDCTENECWVNLDGPTMDVERRRRKMRSSRKQAEQSKSRAEEVEQYCCFGLVNPVVRCILVITAEQ